MRKYNFNADENIINNIPFLVIRTIYDFADGNDDMDLEATNRPV